MSGTRTRYSVQHVSLSEGQFAANPPPLAVPSHHRLEAREP